MIFEDYHKNITDIDLKFNVQLSTSIYIPSLIVRQMSYEIIQPSHGQNIFHIANIIRPFHGQNIFHTTSIIANESFDHFMIKTQSINFGSKIDN